MKKSLLTTSLAIITTVLFTGLVIPPVDTEYDWMVEGNDVDAEFGFWIDGGGDVNGDGYDDVIIGASGYEHDFIGEGAVFIYFGSPSGLSLEPDWVQYGEHDSSGYGRCVSIKGDVNNDGYADVLVGAHSFTGARINEGKVYLYLGGPDGPTTTPYWTKVGGRKGAKLGEAVVFAGDLNNDHYDEICVGAHGWDDDEVLGDSGNKAGKFWIFNGNAEGINPDPFMSCVGIVEDANLGVSMDRAGDVNGDGFNDLHIGGYIFLIGDGMLCTFHGSAVGPDGIPDFMVAGGAMDTSFFAINLSSAGDVNGDGFDDVVIGSPRYDALGVYQSGKLQVYLGSEGGLQPEIAFTVHGTQYDERFAFNVNDAGDLNHDGYDDLLVGSKYYDNGDLQNTGKAEIYLGGPQGLQNTPTWSFVGVDSGNALGTNLANAGDVNGDGYDDIIVSGDEYCGDLLREGAVYMFYGQPQKCEAPQNLTPYFVTPNSVTIGWDWLYGSQKYKFYMRRTDGVGTEYKIITQDSLLFIGGLTSGKEYTAYVAAKCDGGWTDKSEIITFTTPGHKEGELSGMQIYPSPTSDKININLGPATGPVLIRIVNLAGEVVFENQYQIDESHTVIVVNEVKALPVGNYFVLVETSNSKLTKQFVKQ